MGIFTVISGSPISVCIRLREERLELFPVFSSDGSSGKGSSFVFAQSEQRGTVLVKVSASERYPQYCWTFHDQLWLVNDKTTSEQKKRKGSSRIEGGEMLECSGRQISVVSQQLGTSSLTEARK